MLSANCIHLVIPLTTDIQLAFVFDESKDK